MLRIPEIEIWRIKQWTGGRSTDRDSWERGTADSYFDRFFGESLVPLALALLVSKVPLRSWSALWRVAMAVFKFDEILSYIVLKLAGLMTWNFSPKWYQVFRSSSERLWRWSCWFSAFWRLCRWSSCGWRLSQRAVLFSKWRGAYFDGGFGVSSFGGLDILKFFGVETIVGWHV